MKKIVSFLIAMLIIALNVLMAQAMPDIYSYKVGEYEVVLLSEGQQTSKPTMLIGATPELLAKTLPNGTYTSAVNAFLIKTPKANILVDTGFGRKLFDNLKSVGVQAEDIDYVLITHMHGDHIGGLLRDGNIAFPNATLYISTPEVAYWTNKEVMNSMPENSRGGFEAAQRIAAIYRTAGKLKEFEPHGIDETPSAYTQVDGATEALSGIFGLKAFGHTPGHTMFLVESNEEQLLIWADLTHVAAIQLPYPDVSVTYDTDPKQAAESRKRVLELVTANKIPVAGMHIAYPAIGTVEAYGKGYQLIPVSK